MEHLNTQLEVFVLAESTRDFLSGEVKFDGVIRADENPAKFNAILLTKFAMGGWSFAAGAFVLVAAITDRLKNFRSP